jgi:outer membrane receptor for ferrienterochelin and colicin
MSKLRPLWLLRAGARACTRCSAFLCGVALLANSPTVRADAAAGPSDDLTHMSLSELANLDVTSVSKSSEPVQRARATIYVITHEAILRSGVTSVPEALRLAPNLLITQTSSSAYTISARGLGGANLLHARHYESPPPYGEQITRSVIAEARWKF